MKTSDFFHRFSAACAQAVGHSWTFIIALAIIVVWAVTGPMFDYSDTWQLLINTGTTIITFLMVFLIQNAQNRDAEATQLKLDELICAVKDARNDMVNVEDLSDEALASLKEEFARMGDHPDDPVRQRLKKTLGGNARRGDRRREDDDGDGGENGANDAGGSGSADGASAGRASQAPSRPAGHARRKEIQFEEYTQPLHANRRQWT